MKAMWSGVITFGLVTVPVKAYSATEDTKVSFRLLHQECGTPINNRMWCPQHKALVPPEEIVKGWEYAKDQYVVVTDQDLDAVPIPTKQVITIQQFVQAGSLSPLLFEKPYYLGPNTGGSRGYLLLYAAMAQNSAWAIGKVALRNQEQLIILYPMMAEGVVVMNTLRWAEEIRSPSGVDHLEDLQSVTIHPAEHKLANELVADMTEHFAHRSYRDDHVRSLQEILKAKVKGEGVPKARMPEPIITGDIQKALRESVDRARKHKTPQPRETTRRVRK